MYLLAWVHTLLPLGPVCTLHGSGSSLSRSMLGCWWSKGDAGRGESAIPSSPPTICLPLESHSLVQISRCVHRCVPANFYYHVVLYLGSQEPRLWTCRTLLFLPCLTFSPGRPRVGPGPNSRSTPGQLQQLFILREVSVIRKQFPVDPEGSTISSSNRPVRGGRGLSQASGAPGPLHHLLLVPQSHAHLGSLSTSPPIKLHRADKPC